MEATKASLSDAQRARLPEATRETTLHRLAGRDVLEMDLHERVEHGAIDAFDTGERRGRQRVDPKVKVFMSVDLHLEPYAERAVTRFASASDSAAYANATTMDSAESLACPASSSPRAWASRRNCR